MATKHELLQYLRERSACYPAMRWAKKQKSAKDIIEKCPEADWLSWLSYVMRGGVLRKARLRTYDDLQRINEMLWSYAISHDDHRDRVLRYFKKLVSWERVNQELEIWKKKKCKAERKAKANGR